MNALLRLLLRNRKRLAVAGISSILAGLFAYERRRKHAREYPTPATDGGPIVDEPSLLQRIIGLIPVRKTKPANTSGGGQGNTTTKPSTTPTKPIGKTFSDVIERTPIPKRPESAKTAEQIQRTKDTDGPDFGPEFRIKR